MRACGTLSSSSRGWTGCAGRRRPSAAPASATAGMSPKYCATFSFAVATSMSPASTSTALFGPYQAAEPVLHVVERGRVEVGHRADRAVVVRVAGRVQRLARARPRPGRRAGSRPGASRSGPRRAARRASPGRSRRAGGPCGRTPSTAPCRARWSARSGSSWCGRELVVPFWSVAPTSSNGSKNSPWWFSEPWNIRCSNRCAKPVRPAGSSLQPTWYQRLTATIGALRSVCTITRRPLGRVNCSYGMSTRGLGRGQRRRRREGEAADRGRRGPGQARRRAGGRRASERLRTWSTPG